MTAVLLQARAVLTGHDGALIPHGGVLVEDGTIIAVGTAVDLRSDADEIEDAGAVLIPGLVDAHSHLRGVPLERHGIRPAPLETWICSLAACAPLSPGDEALVASAELLETGVTAVQGMVHTYEDADGLRTTCAGIEAGVRAAGIRALLVLGYTDKAERAPEPAVGDWAALPPVQHGLDLDGFTEVAQERLAASAAPGAPRWGVGPVAAQWVGDDGLSRLASLAEGRRVHTHLNESALQRTWLAGRPAPLERLEAAGLVDGALSAAHGVHLTDDELSRLAAAGTVVVHCPASNRALQVGAASVASWLRHGVTAALGIDSQGEDAPDMFAVMREALRTATELGDPLTPAQVFAMATTGGAAALGDGRLGRLRPGGHADLVSLDVAPAVTRDEQVHGIVADGGRHTVRHAWVGGKAVVRDGHAVADTVPARDRLEAALAADETARHDRLAALEPLLGAVERARAEVAA